jgi:RHS repeat-associated protein
VIEIAKLTRNTAFSGSWRICGLILVFSSLSAVTVGQTIPPPISGFTPIGITPGAPAGSYPLSGFDNINLYNGNLGIHMPLMQVGGRGSAAYQMMLNIEVRWLMNKLVSCDQSFCAVSYGANANWWSAIRAGYGPGVLQGRFPSYQDEFEPCDPEGNMISLARLTFTEPNGTEHELIDVQSDGQPKNSPCPIAFWDRGTVFRSYDGTSMTFVSDSPINDSGSLIKGRLMLRDGTRYDIQDGIVMRIRDRNGNVMNFEYQDDPTFPGHFTDKLLKITDSLNRKVNITYHTNTTTNSFDQITFTGFDGATRTIKVKYSMLSSALRAGQTIKTYEQLFPSPPDITVPPGNELFDREVVSELHLPNVGAGSVGRYVFRYNSYSELARVELPTGGAYEYDHFAGSGTMAGGVVAGPLEDIDGNQSMGVYRRVTEKRIFKENGIEEGRMKFFENYDEPSSSTIVTLQHCSPGTNGPVLAQDKHYFFGNPGTSQVSGSGGTGGPRPTDYSPWNEGIEYKSEALDTDTNSTVLRRIENQFEPRRLKWTNGGLSNDSHLIETVTTLDPTLSTKLVAKSSSIDPVSGAIGFDAFNNPTDIWEYDFGPGSVGALIRRTHTDYVKKNPDPSGPNYQSNTDIHIRSLTKQVSVFDAGGVERSRTKFEYDHYNQTSPDLVPDVFHAPITNRADITSLDGTFTTTYYTRGNPTKTTRYLLNSSGGVIGSISGHVQFDIAGNPVKIVDPRSTPTNIIVTTLDFSDRFGVPDNEAESNTRPSELQSPLRQTYAFATKVTNPLSHDVFTQFDYYTGKPVNTKDANLVITKGFYNDALDRPSLVVTAVGLALLERQTSFDYNDAVRTIITHSDLEASGDALLTTVAFYDGLGRTTDTQIADPQGDVFAKREYDPLGRVSRVFNPYRTASDSTYGTTVTAYDVLGRVVQVATFNGLGGSTGAVNTAYDGARVQVTDQAGKKRISQTDALGRLTDVWELTPADSATESLTFQGSTVTGYRTKYAYDVFDDLTQVTQRIGTSGTLQTRTFAYDSLRRLTSATNPESGGTAISYTYDENSNLKTRLDTRGITTTYNYDVLNRVINRTTTDATPRVDYLYDSQSLPQGAPTFVRGASTGRLVATTYGGPSSSTGSYQGYDAQGRPNVSAQKTDSESYIFPNYSYNLAGQMTSQTYPSGRVVATVYDTAGRIAGVVKNQASGLYYAGAAATDATNRIQYAAHGAVSKIKLGNEKWEHTNFNTRLQPIEIGLGTSGTDSSMLKLEFGYGPDMNNNGNVLTQKITAPGLTLNQCYGYDSLNRLSTAIERSGGTNCSGTQQWKQAFTYDRFGNRNFDATNTTVNVLGPNPTINQANNRFTSGQNYGYDSAGNLTSDPATLANGIVYDAENRQTQYTKTGQLTNSYQYDGAGHRVKKIDNNGTTIFVYNVENQLIAEYTSGAPSGVGGTSYLTSDHLGSTRVVMKSDGNARHDFLPFGEELQAGIGGRTSGLGYVADSVRQKFTQKERDIESGLDYFHARYYSSAQGRFLSPDEPFADQEEREPQSWNLYPYVTNNPLAFTDSLGLFKEKVFGGQTYWEVAEGDSYSSLSKATGIAVGLLQQFFQNVTFHPGELVDLTGFGAWYDRNYRRVVTPIRSWDLPVDGWRIELTPSLPIPGIGRLKRVTGLDTNKLIDIERRGAQALRNTEGRLVVSRQAFGEFLQGSTLAKVNALLRKFGIEKFFGIKNKAAFEAALEQGLKLGLTPKDATILATAKAQGTALITRDKAIINAAKEIGVKIAPW